ncbi:speedy protein A [Nelusetta ayraudi]|uniref:speedy protein A n=1 Tax=Nelusetta ayraudi TaxID=303726 RepID=UPI003F703409
MKHTSRWRQTPPSVTVWVTPSESPHCLQIKRCPQVKRAHSRGSQSPTKRSQRRDERHPVKMIKAPALSLQRQAMAPFFRLFDDRCVRDFLCVDCCCTLTDKYLLAMTFVYFKRACFAITEYTTKNFFLALYLANTMEEDEEETKYGIFPWALGKNWRRRFPCFLRQRDKLWARIGYRAAVSKTCCEEVMSIWPSHFAWSRERSEKHSGAQRHYGERTFSLPRDRTASRAPCSLCDRIATANQLAGPSLHPRISPEVSARLCPPLAVESTPLSAEAREIQPRCSASRCSVEDLRVSTDCDSSLDWINEE